MKTKKKFDCVEMMHEGARKIQEQLKGKSVEERVAYWREQNAIGRKEQEEIMAKAKNQGAKR